MAQPTLTVAPNRHIDIARLMEILNDQKARAMDVIAGSGTLSCQDGKLIIAGTEARLSPDGVTSCDGTYELNDIALGGIAEKLKIPGPYLRRMADENLPALDYNINTWLERDHRRFLVRCRRSANAAAGADGVTHAFLSDRFLRLDNLDVLLAALDGIRKAGVAVKVASCDLTDRRVYVRFISPEVQVMAPELLRNYRSPFDGRRGSDLPVIFGGFLLTNSETGFGKYSVAPFIRVEICKNGQTIDKGVLSRTHIGAKITDDDGIIDPSPQTLRKLLELITAQTIDAVRAYLDVDFVTRAVRDLEQAAGIVVSRPDETIKIVGKELKYTEEQQKEILAHFITGADLSAGGIMQAVTSFGRSVADADVAYRMETTATQALHLAARAATA
ncbi:DUF932 domain-containing protein [Actinoplanes flavus]|uniref:DUF932 domain-containing protein n=1 Tax=Actinoplanes flavus TaxID=2820290 RepID=A0ABS3UD23_9ACTN|nr:DUF932 domain-containing protein [Actinoplanes flavus]MBO3736679.1 DUF932 domain-containing protein [Actinoplanes flavus]